MTATDLGTFARDVTGHEPSGLWSAPGRVNLIGEHVDYNAGIVLPLAIPFRTAVAVSPREDGGLLMVSRQRPDEVVEPLAIADLAPGPGTSGQGWRAYVAGTVWALRDRLAADAVSHGLNVVVDGAVPVGAGLSSSAALECAVALAVNDLEGLGADLSQLARIAQHAENDYVGVPSGLMDQLASMTCRAGHALEIDFRDDTARQVPLDLAALGLVLVVIDTRVHHALGDGGYAARLASCREAEQLLGVPSLREAPLSEVERLSDEVVRRRARHVVSEIERVQEAVDALEAGDTARLGALMVQSHRSLQHDYEVSVPELDLAVDTALAAGAVGARMTGGGFGGSAIALVEAGRADALVTAVGAAFRRRRFRAPSCFPVLPSEGARRDA
ncbi:MAG: galactokinase [Actinomycetales bacterium]